MQLAPREFGATVAELSARTGRPEQTIRNALRRLRAAGLVDPEEGSWPPRWAWLHDRDLREVARDLGVDGRSERRARRFDAERADFSRLVRRRRPRGDAAGR